MGTAPGGAGVPTLHVVTDDDVLACKDFVDLAMALLRVGGSRIALHVRGPRTAGGEILRLTSSLARPAREAGGVLVVNGRVDVALCAGARAVHLGVRSLTPADARRVLGRDASIGVSAHDPLEVAEASGAGVRWIFMGTIWETPSHPSRAGGGVEAVSRAVDASGGVPVLAIGGVTPERAARVREAGAHGVAVIRGVWEAPDPRAAVNDYLEVLAPVAGGKKATR